MILDSGKRTEGTGEASRRFYETYGTDYKMLPEGKSVTGDISSDQNGARNFKISGTLEGEIFADGVVYVARTGIVKGNIIADCILVDGRCEGNMIASIKIELRKDARVQCNCKTPDFVRDAESNFKGKIEDFDDNSEPAIFEEKRDDFELIIE